MLVSDQAPHCIHGVRSTSAYDQKSLFVMSEPPNAGGEEDWQVSCICGCRDDDGERMVACDCCGLWMHLRCQGIPDCTPSPDEFICSRCRAKGAHKSRLKQEEPQIVGPA